MGKKIPFNHHPISEQLGQAKVSRQGWEHEKETARVLVTTLNPGAIWRGSSWKGRRLQPPRMSASGQWMTSAALWRPVWLWRINIGGRGGA